MKKFVLSFMLLIFLSITLQSQTCQWAEKLLGTWDEFPQSMAVEANGDFYLTGIFCSDTLTFNNGIALIQDSGTIYDGFIAKYDKNGICKWAQMLAGNSEENLYTISLDSNSNFYIGGYFSSDSLRFNNGIILTAEKIGELHSDGFIAKYDSNGICLWAQKIFGHGYQEVRNIEIDKNGDVFVSGQFHADTTHFNNGKYVTKSSCNYEDFIAKYSSDGICQWATSIFGASGDYVGAISVGKNNFFYAFGYFSSDKLIFNNNIELINNSAPNYSHESDGFIAKYNNDGVCQWARKFGGINSEDF